MPRIPVYAANWKMNKSLGEAETFCHDFLNKPNVWSRAHIVVFPPFTALQVVRSSFEGQGIFWGAQNVYPAESGAFTGEVSPPMLRDLGCSWVLVGHSERRHVLGEDNPFIALKVARSLRAGLLVNLCVGETEQQRDTGTERDVVSTQLRTALTGVEPEQVAQMCLSYEPVWAIGTGRVATAEQAQEMCKFVRNEVARSHGDPAAGAVRVLYGGSVKPENIAEISSQSDIDGALIGGAALKADSFHGVIVNGLG